MLLDVELKIKVTNNGKENQIALMVDKDTKFQHACTAVGLATESLSHAAQNYLKKTTDGKCVDEDFVSNQLSTITFNDLDI